MWLILSSLIFFCCCRQFISHKKSLGNLLEISQKFLLTLTKKMNCKNTWSLKASLLIVEAEKNLNFLIFSNRSSFQLVIVSWRKRKIKNVFISPSARVYSRCAQWPHKMTQWIFILEFRNCTIWYIIHLYKIARLQSMWYFLPLEPSFLY